jgi:trimethylamine---corrinoid protein Co-methyltransferase
MFSLQVLDEKTLERMHREALGILSRVGVEVQNEQLLQVFRQHGLPVEDLRVRLPAEVVEAALKTVPAGFSLHDRNGNELPLEQGRSYFYSYPNSINVVDYGAQGLRPSTKQDVINWVRLGDALPEIAIANDGCYARDEPEMVQELHTVAAVISNTTKHNLSAPLNLQEAEIWIELDEIARGGQGHPAISSGFGTTSPLRVDEDSAEVLLYAVRKKIPSTIISCPIAGGSSPTTIIGSLVLQLAEILFVITATQLVREGAPLIMVGGTGIMDLRTGALSYGAVERRLIMAASVQHAARYNMPSMAGSLSIDPWQPDVQAGAEKMIGILTYLAVSSLPQGYIWGAAGGLAAGLACSLEQMVIDVDQLKMAQRFQRGLDTGEDAWAIEAIERVGPGGNYLADEHTLRWMRSEEIYRSDIANLDGDRGQSMLERAHAKVERILAEHQPAVSEETVQEIEQYVEDRTRSILGKN